MSEQPEAYYTAEQVAERFQLDSARHIIRNASRFPHIVIARQVRFTEDHIRQIAAMHEQRSDTDEAAPAFASQVTRGQR